MSSSIVWLTAAIALCALGNLVVAYLLYLERVTPVAVANLVVKTTQNSNYEHIYLQVGNLSPFGLWVDAAEITVRLTHAKASATDRFSIGDVSEPQRPWLGDIHWMVRHTADKARGSQTLKTEHWIIEASVTCRAGKDKRIVVSTCRYDAHMEPLRCLGLQPL